MNTQKKSTKTNSCKFHIWIGNKWTNSLTQLKQAANSIGGIDSNWLDDAKVSGEVVQWHLKNGDKREKNKGQSKKKKQNNKTSTSTESVIFDLE